MLCMDPAHIEKRKLFPKLYTSLTAQLLYGQFHRTHAPGPNNLYLISFIIIFIYNWYVITIVLHRQFLLNLIVYWFIICLLGLYSLRVCIFAPQKQKCAEKCLCCYFETIYSKSPTFSKVKHESLWPKKRHLHYDLCVYYATAHHPVHADQRLFLTFWLIWLYFLQPMQSNTYSNIFALI